MSKHPNNLASFKQMHKFVCMRVFHVAPFIKVYETPAAVMLHTSTYDIVSMTNILSYVF